jgi:hypothetical protein
VTFGWNAGSGAIAYWLEVGATPGGRQISGGSRLTSLSTVVTGLPANGSTVHVRLWSLIGGSWVFNDYQFVASGTPPAKAQMVSPAPGSTFTDTTVAFTWSAGSGVAAYWLEVGTSPGGRQISGGSSLTSLSTVVGGMPSDGSTVHVRLWSRMGTVWAFNDYTYLATTGAGPARAEMSSPTPGSSLTSTTVTFSWSTGTGVTAYWLEVGTSPGGRQISGGTSLASTSTVVRGLPADGTTVYVRLWSRLGTAWVYADYTYSALGP